MSAPSSPPDSGAASVELVDTHCHLDMAPYRDEVPQLLAEAADCGVVQVLSIGIDYPSSVAALALAGRHDGVYASIGFHPHAAEAVDERSLREVAALAGADKVVAYGEIGLDYVRDYAEPEVQRRAFRQQLELAIELELPVIIHDREAHDDTIRLIREAGPLPRGGVMHCFSGDRAFAEEMIALGFMLSIPGIVTFKSAETLHEVVRTISLSHLMLETDGPFLAPMPHRGKRNQPAYLLHTARRVAQLKDMPLEEIARQTTANARALFHLPAPERP